jgi:hypothetical protein
MTRKKIILLLLALAITTSLSAGTLAIYSKSVTAVDNSVRAKLFSFTTNGARTFDTDFLLAPKDSWCYSFSVNNFDGAGTTEVALDYTVTVNDRDATNALTGLKTTLEKQIGNNRWIVLATSTAADTNGAFSLKDDGYNASGKSSGKGATDAGKKSTITYRITLTWEDNGDNDAVQTDQGLNPPDKRLSVTITASQNTESANITNEDGNKK